MPFNWNKSEKTPGTEGASPSKPSAPKESSRPVSPSPPATSLGLEIKAVASFLLERSGKGLALPTISITPIDPDQPPEITGVRIVGVSANKALADWLTEAYKAAVDGVPRRLKQSFSIAPRTQQWPSDQPITHDESSNNAITIAVEHRPIGPDGRTGAEKVTATAKILLLEGESVLPTATLTVRPQYLLKVFEMGGGGRGVGPQLEIRLRTRSPKAPAGCVPEPLSIALTAPELPLLAAKWGCTWLSDVVATMLRAVGPGRTTSDGLLIRAVPRFQLDPSQRSALNDYRWKTAGGPLRIPVRVQGTGALPVQFQIELNPQGHIQEGLIVLDLGTSTSVACRFDPMIVERSVFAREQLARLKEDFAAFLSEPDKEIVDEAESHWLDLLKAVAAQCGLTGHEDPGVALQSRMTFTVNSDRGAEAFYEVLRQFELQLWSLDAPLDPTRNLKLKRFQERVAAKLHHFYTRAFGKVPLGQWNIGLCRREDEASDFVVSELELKDLEPLPAGVLGSRSAQHRIEWLAGMESKPLGSIKEGRFLECPKRFLSHIHEDSDLVKLGAWPVKKVGSDLLVKLTAREALQAAWQFLVDTGRGPTRPGLDGIDQVAVTYPADLMPEPRGQLEQALRELGMVTVHLDFDESVSPAIFHLEQLFGSMEEIGCEAFKVRCVREPKTNIWAHHMLVLDIGAGTTDISLIRLEMRESPPDASEFGGRLYVITPKLLGAAGRSQSGGHQLTLRIFRTLKQLVANWVLNAAAGASPDAGQPPERGMNIVLPIEDNDDPALTAALEAADRVIPTRFQELYQHLRAEGGPESTATDLADVRRRLERFHLLWNWAEALKLYLSDLILKKPGGALESSVLLDDFMPGGSSWLNDTLEKLLAGTPYQPYLPNIMNPEANPVPPFRIADFEQLATIAVERSVKLATSMAASALQNFGKRQGDGIARLLQSVVLSGRACKLPAVEEQLRLPLQQVSLGAGKAKVLFREEYAKSATAIGACRAQRRIASARPHVGPPARLEGKCEMDIRIDNLFFYLPASYHTGTASNQLGVQVFERHTEYRQFGSAPRGVIRSGGFEQPARETLIFRDDGDGAGVLQGRLVVQDLIADRTLSNRILANECATWRVRFEINHHKQLAALLIRPGPGANSTAETVDPIYDVGEAASDPRIIVDLNDQRLIALLAGAHTRCPVHISLRPPAPNSQGLISADAMTVVRCLASRARSAAAESTSKATPANAPSSPRIITGWLGPVMPEEKLGIPRGGRVTFYLVDVARNLALQTVTVEPKPRDPDNPDATPSRFPFLVNFRTLLTEDGRFALIIGDEANYWETDNVDEWLANPPGTVLRHKLEAPPPQVDWWREPFCGKH
jgi:hypothetical protein